MYLKSWDTNCFELSSKEAPKKVTAIGENGKLFNFLCKHERKGDLRKDSRVMDLCTLVRNRNFLIVKQYILERKRNKKKKNAIQNICIYLINSRLLSV